MKLIPTNINPFPEEAILYVKSEVFSSRVTAKTFLRLYSKKSSPEARAAAEAVRSGDYLQSPLAVMAHDEIYSKTLTDLEEGADILKTLHYLYSRLYTPFMSAGVFDEL